MPRSRACRPLLKVNRLIMPKYMEEAPGGGFYWGPLTSGRLLRRYKRFLADVELPGGEIITAHTANTGRMTGCAEPGRPVWLSRHDRPGRQYPYSWEMIRMPGGLVGVNTMLPNRLAAQAAALGLIAETNGPMTVEREVSVGHSRLDLRLTDARGRTILVEVKSCTLAEGGTAYFPDAITARGAKHLDELTARVGGGVRAAVMVLVQRGDADRFSPADHIDPAWGRRLRTALAAGVEVWVYQAELSLSGVALGRKLPLNLDTSPT